MEVSNEPKIERVVAYIDGFNLYFGLISSFPTMKWLNIYSLSESLLQPHQQLVGVKYFTSSVTNDPPKEHRQRTYLSAVESTGASIIYGQYRSRPKHCRRCNHNWNDNEEKMTDVNIAVHLLIDALNDQYDTALLISGDSDLVPPIQAVHQNFHNKRVLVAFPPNRFNNSVKNVARGSLMIGRRSFASNQFSQVVTSISGNRLNKPAQW